MQKTCQCLGTGIVQVSIFPFYLVSDEKRGSCTPQNSKPQHTTGQKWVEHNRQCLFKLESNFQWLLVLTVKKEMFGHQRNSLLLHAATCLILMAWLLRVSHICWSIFWTMSIGCFCSLPGECFFCWSVIEQFPYRGIRTWQMDGGSRHQVPGEKKGQQHQPW